VSETSFHLATRDLGPLPLINHTLDRLAIGRFLSEALSPAGNGALSHAQALGALLRNILDGRRPIYGVGEWAAPFAPDLLGLSLEQSALLRDDRVGRALEALFDADRASLLTRVVLWAVKEFRLDLSQLHDDATTISFTGSYDDADGGYHRGKPTVALRRSLASKDHRPDLKQIFWFLDITTDGAVPIHYRVMDGNVSESTTHRETWTQLRRLVGKADFLYVADSKLCSEPTMSFIHGEGGRFLTVVPETRNEPGEFRGWLQSHTPMWMEVPEGFGKGQRGMAELKGSWRTTEAPTPSREGFRIVWVWSAAKEVRDQEARRGIIARSRRRLEELEKRLQSSRCRIHTSEGAVTAAEGARGEEARRWVDYELRTEELPRFHQEGRGRPGKNTKYRREDRYRFHVDARVNEEAVAQDARSDGMFPLMTNEKGASGAELLARYKFQPRLERRHEELKTVYRVAPIFLKSVTRIEGLLFVYFLAMLTEGLMERELRTGMAKEKVEALPLYPEERDCRAPTMRRVLEVFGRMQRHELWQGEKRAQVFLTEMTGLQKQILSLMGVPEEVYQRYQQ